MDYRSRWQQRRRQESRRRLLWVAGAVALAVVLSAAVSRCHRGEQAWQRDLRADSPVYFAATGGTLLCATPDGTAEALAVATGRRLWPETVHRPKGFGATPCVADSRILYVGDAGVICALARGSGERIWEVETGGPIRCPPLVEGDVAYVGSDDGNLYALGVADGIERWRYNAGAPVSSGCALAGNTLVFGTVEGKIVGLSKHTGRLAPWRELSTGMPIHARPCLADGAVAVANDAGQVYLVDPATGATVARATVPCGGLVRAGLLADTDSLYVGTTDGWLVAYELRPRDRGRRLVSRWVRSVGRELSAGPVLDGSYVYCANGRGDITAITKTTGRSRYRWVCPGRPQGSLAVAQGLVITSTARGQVIAFRIPDR